MKRVLVRLEYVFELPDHVRIEEPVQEADQMLFVHGRLLVPEVGWMALCEIGDEPGVMTTEQLPDDLKEQMMDALCEVNEQSIEVLN